MACRYDFVDLLFEVRKYSTTIDVEAMGRHIMARVAVLLSLRRLGVYVACAHCKRWPKSFGAQCHGEDLTSDTDQYGACGACMWVVYCSRACQEADWPRHRAECLAVTH